MGCPAPVQDVDPRRKEVLRRSAVPFSIGATLGAANLGPGRGGDRYIAAVCVFLAASAGIGVCTRLLRMARNDPGPLVESDLSLRVSAGIFALDAALLFWFRQNAAVLAIAASSAALLAGVVALMIRRRFVPGRQAKTRPLAG